MEKDYNELFNNKELTDEDKRTMYNFIETLLEIVIENINKEQKKEEL